MSGVSALARRLVCFVVNDVNVARNEIIARIKLTTCIFVVM